VACVQISQKFKDPSSAKTEDYASNKLSSDGFLSIFEASRNVLTF